MKRGESIVECLICASIDYYHVHLVLAEGFVMVFWSELRGWAHQWKKKLFFA